MAGFFIALISGALMSIQGVFNTQVTKTTGVWVSNGWVQITALRLGADHGVRGLPGGMAFYRAGQCLCHRKGRAEVYAAGRGDRRCDHMDCDQERCGAGTCEVRAPHCHRPARGIVSHPALRDVRHGQRAVLLAETGRAPCGSDRDRGIPVGVGEAGDYLRTHVIKL